MTDSVRTLENEKRETAIAALLTEKSIRDAAAVVGVSDRTLRRWMADDKDFRDQYREARLQVVEHAITRLQKACDTAVKTLEDVMQDSDAAASARVAASRAVLDTSIAGLERDRIEQRLDEIEERLDGGIR